MHGKGWSPTAHPWPWWQTFTAWLRLPVYLQDVIRRWRCSGLAFHPSHPTALHSFLLTYQPHQTMLPWTQRASPTTLPAPASSLFPLTSAFLLHLQETELWPSAPKHRQSSSEITTFLLYSSSFKHSCVLPPSLPPRSIPVPTILAQNQSSASTQFISINIAL